jgi:phosphoribosylformylglycinamidine synthase
MASGSKDWGVIVFPGSNCDHDAFDVAGRLMGRKVHSIWHRDDTIPDVSAVIVPGGFSYGDYLRSGAIARFAPVMNSVIDFANQGGLVLGICNGFQILTEAGLLPGVMNRNVGLRFICREVYLRVERDDTRFTRRYTKGQVIKIPIAHNEGNFYLPDDELDQLEANGQVVFRYCDRKGNVTEEANPNGASRNIAGIINREGNVLGMMPHPERRSDPLLGRPDGADIFRSMGD